MPLFDGQDPIGRMVITDNTGIPTEVDEARIGAQAVFTQPVAIEATVSWRVTDNVDPGVDFTSLILISGEATVATSGDITSSPSYSVTALAGAAVTVQFSVIQEPGTTPVAIREFESTDWDRLRAIASNTPFGNYGAIQVRFDSFPDTNMSAGNLGLVEASF